MDRKATVFFLITLAVLAGCSKRESPARPTPIFDGGTLAGSHPDIAVGTIDVSPETIHAGEAATVTVQLAEAPPPDTSVTVAWFGPSGWNIIDDTKTATQARVAFAAPISLLDHPGRYRVAVRTDGLYQGEKHLTVVE